MYIWMFIFFFLAGLTLYIYMHIIWYDNTIPNFNRFASEACMHAYNIVCHFIFFLFRFYFFFALVRDFYLSNNNLRSYTGDLYIYIHREICAILRLRYIWDKIIGVISIKKPTQYIYFVSSVYLLFIIIYPLVFRKYIYVENLLINGKSKHFWFVEKYKKYNL